jgi:hypothetical protein
MYKRTLYTAIFLFLPVMASADAVDTLLDSYRQAGAKDFSLEQGEARWKQKHAQADGKSPRSCQDCHGNDLTQIGKHATTGKQIDPMAPSVNQKRLSDGKKIEKWFKRNCKWTLGRECTPQEKGDFLIYLRQQ